MLRLVHPAPKGQVSVRPLFRRTLTEEESTHVRAAMKNLCRFYGRWAIIAELTGFAKNTLKCAAHNKREKISLGMALAIAELTRTPIEHLLTGRPREIGVCPTCGARTGGTP
jgi:hypothetical protein